MPNRTTARTFRRNAFFSSGTSGNVSGASAFAVAAADKEGRTTKTGGALRLRWFTRGELENLLELEGFQITDYWGSFGREPFGEGATEQIIRAVVL